MGSCGILKDKNIVKGITMESWEKWVKNPETGVVHEFNLDCQCGGCKLIRRSNETRRESKVGGHKKYRGAHHNRKAGQQALDGSIVKVKKRKPNGAQERKNTRSSLEEE